MMEDACVRHIEIIGEVCKRISEELKAKNANIAWKKMAGMRDIMIHDYTNVDLDIVWLTVSRNIPELSRAIQEIIENETNI